MCKVSSSFFKLKIKKIKKQKLWQAEPCAFSSSSSSTTDFHLAKAFALRVGLAGGKLLCQKLFCGGYGAFDASSFKICRNRRKTVEYDFQVASVGFENLFIFCSNLFRFDGKVFGVCA
jgi:hypothetical protein